MKQLELVRRVAEVSGSSQVIVKGVLNALCSELSKVMAEKDSIRLAGLGTFSVTDCKERKARNLQTGKEMIVPAYSRVKFKAAKALKDAVK